jgi:L-lactate dehydrogenase (cytochrome)/(S)-mandelate dehydrogenase
MKLKHVINTSDFRRLAKSCLPRLVFDFIDGGVDAEECLEQNVAAFRRYRLLPRYLTGADAIDMSVNLFGRDYAAPFGIAPMGLLGMFRPHADLILARAAQQRRVPYIMSSASSDSLEEAMAIAPDVTWFQLYLTLREEINEDLVRRARNAGVQVLVVTIDIPTPAKRERNLRNGFTRPMKMTPQVVLQGMARPLWSLRFYRHGGIPVMKNWAPYASNPNDANVVADLYGSQTPAPGLRWDTIERMRAGWKGALVIKGVLTPEDAQRCAQIGVDGVIVSNHGGRQLDRAPASLEVLPAINRAVADKLTVMMDGGIRRGADIVTAVGLGAKAAFFGRPAIFAAASAADAGADKLLGIFRTEIEVVMRQMGCSSLGDITADRLWDQLNAAPPG